MWFFHVQVEITVVIICHFLLFDYKNIFGYVTGFLNVTQYCSISFSKNLYFVGYLHSVGQTLYVLLIFDKFPIKFSLLMPFLHKSLQTTYRFIQRFFFQILFVLSLFYDDAYFILMLLFFIPFLSWWILGSTVSHLDVFWYHLNGMGAQKLHPRKFLKHFFHIYFTKI